MSRSIWKGPFNQNIDTHEKKVCPTSDATPKVSPKGQPYGLVGALRDSSPMGQPLWAAPKGADPTVNPKRSPTGNSPKVLRKSKAGPEINSPSKYKAFNKPPALRALHRPKSLQVEEKKQVWCRSSMILPQYVGRSFFIYNGKTFISICISPKMLGHKFGEFASTRQKPIHKKKK